MSSNDQRLREIMSSVFGIDLSAIDSSFSRDSSEIWDSFNHLLLISKIEEAFQMSFTMEEVLGINTVEDLADGIERHKSDS